MKIRVFFLIISIIGLGAGIMRYFMLAAQNTTPFHIHAGFEVFVDGKKQDYSSSKYMEIEPCTKEHEAVEENDQLEKVHLHDGVGDVVHVHRRNATWSDLFQNIQVTFSLHKPIVGWVNGKKVSDIMRTSIHAYDSVIIIVGDDTGVDVSKYVSPDYIHEIEAKGETCGNGVS